MKKLLLAAMATLAITTAAKSETVLEMGNATDIWGYSYVDQETFLQKDYTVKNLTEFTVDGYGFYIQSFGKDSWLVCTDPEERQGYFEWRGLTYFEITAPAGEYIQNFTMYCCGPEGAGHLGAVDGQNVHVTVVNDLNNAQTQSPIGVVTYSEPDQMEISWTNTTTTARNKICVRTPAFSYRQIYRIVINSSTPGVNNCVMTASPSPKAKLYAGSCGTEEQPEGLAALRLNFDQTGVTVNEEADDIITLSCGDKLVGSWELPEILTDESGCDYCELPGVNARMTVNPGEYQLTIPEGFFIFEDRELSGGTVKYNLVPNSENMLTLVSPEQSDDLYRFDKVVFGFGEEYEGIAATDSFKTQIYKLGVIQPLSAGILGKISDENHTINVSLMNNIEGKGYFDIVVDEGSFVVCKGSADWGPYVYNAYFSQTVELAEDPNGVEGISAVNPQDVYGIDGRLMMRQATGLEGLAKGMYIIGGKKVIVK